MSKIDDGGPAFPQAAAEFVDHPTHGRVSLEALGLAPLPGMTLRDWFAGQALAGIARSPIAPGIVGRESHIADAAHYAYAIADAMIAESKRGSDA